MGRFAFAVRYSVVIGMALAAAVLGYRPALDDQVSDAQRRTDAKRAETFSDGTAAGRRGQDAPKAAPVSLVPVPVTEGIQNVFTSEMRLAPLRIITPAGDEDYFIKIADAWTGTVMMTLFAPGGTTTATKVPIGSATLKYASGREWYGENHLFGPETKYSQADEVLDFTQDHQGVRGYTVELLQQADGNLNIKSIAGTDF